MLSHTTTCALNGSDREYMDRLYRQYSRLMYYLAWQYSADPHTVDDIVSDACIALMRNTQTLRRLCFNAQKSYVTAAVSSSAINRLNHASRTAELLTNAARGHLESISGKISLEHQIALRDELKRALQAISKQERQILLLKYEKGLRNGEIATLMGMTEHAVGKRLQRMRQRLKAAIER